MRSSRSPGAVRASAPGPGRRAFSMKLPRRAAPPHRGAAAVPAKPCRRPGQRSRTVSADLDLTEKGEAPTDHGDRAREARFARSRAGQTPAAATMPKSGNHHLVTCIQRRRRGRVARRARSRWLRRCHGTGYAHPKRSSTCITTWARSASTDDLTAGGEPPGRWMGRGAQALGLSGPIGGTSAEGKANAEVMRGLYHHDVAPDGTSLTTSQRRHKYPDKGAQAAAAQERIDAQVAVLGRFATPEKIRDIEIAERAKVRSQTPFYDMVVIGREVREPAAGGVPRRGEASTGRRARAGGGAVRSAGRADRSGDRGDRERGCRVDRAARRLRAHRPSQRHVGGMARR